MPRPPDAARTESPEERRERAWHLVVVRRLTEREAARILEVHEGTVRRDLAAMRARGQKAVERASTRKGVLRMAAEMWGQLSAVLREAWVSVQAAPDSSSVRVRALNTVRATVKDMAEILQSLGLLPKAPEEVLIGARDPSQLTDEQLQAAVAFFLSVSGHSLGAAGDVADAAGPEAVDRGQPVDQG